MTDRAKGSARPGRLQLPNLVAGVVIGGLLVGAVAPLVGSDGGTNVATSGTPGFLSDEPGSFEPSEDPGGTAASATDGTGASVGPTGGSAVGPASTGSGGSSAPAASGPTAGASGGSPAGANENIARTASDVGVTKEVIRVGSLTLNCKACPALGVKLDPTPHHLIAKAFVDDINARGGINGRKLELYTKDVDPAEDAVNGGGTEREACIELTQRRKVFAVVMGGTFANACIYQENRTPLITPNDPAIDDPRTFDAAEGRVWLLSPSSARTLLNWARQLDRMRMLTPSTKFGVVLLDGPQRVQVERYLLAELKRLGYTPAHVSVMPNDYATVSVKAASEVPTMQGKGVTHVLMATDYAPAESFVREAERNEWKPQWLQSDFPGGAHDYQGDQNSKAGDWSGAIAISSAPEAPYEQVRRQPAARRCVETYERSSGRRSSELLFGHVLNYCNTYGAFERAAKAAGANPTRASLVGALARVGEFPYAGSHQGVGFFGGRYSLGPVKWSATDWVQRKVYRSPCPRPQDPPDSQEAGCYVPDGAPFRMAA